MSSHSRGSSFDALSSFFAPCAFSPFSAFASPDVLAGDNELDGAENSKIGKNQPVFENFILGNYTSKKHAIWLFLI